MKRKWFKKLTDKRIILLLVVVLVGIGISVGAYIHEQNIHAAGKSEKHDRLSSEKAKETQKFNQTQSAASSQDRKMERALIGLWQKKDGSGKQQILFNKDGTVVIFSWNNNDPASQARATYSVSNGLLILRSNAQEKKIPCVFLKNGALQLDNITYQKKAIQYEQD